MKQGILLLLICLLPGFWGCTGMKSAEEDMRRLLEHMEIDRLSQKPDSSEHQPPAPAAPAPASDSRK
ncbi:MAG: hypothetical protein RBT16_14950, partial [Desulfococcus multivorans]|nr:hypothetical protein [Desulfococcus multivorans]